MGPAGSLWVEYKYIKQLPIRDKTNLKTSLNLLQIEWLNNLYDYNHKACLIIGIENTAIILEDKMWLENISKQFYVENCIPRKEVAQWIESICLPDIYEQQGKEHRD